MQVSDAGVKMQVYRCSPYRHCRCIMLQALSLHLSLMLWFHDFTLVYRSAKTQGNHVIHVPIQKADVTKNRRHKYIHASIAQDCTKCSEGPIRSQHAIACLLILRTVVRAGRGSNSLLANSLSHWQLRPLLHSSSSWVLQSQEIVKDKKARLAGSKGVARELRRNRLEIVNDVNAVNRMGWGCCRGTWICPHLQIGGTNMHACLSLSTVWCGHGETLNYKMIWMHIDKSWEVTNHCFRCLMLPSRF